ncbi:MAG: hypothetical protein IJ518_06255 [Clostridia bacterium]|nr:hypothetical protein [Clostridia bacterium]
MKKMKQNKMHIGLRATALALAALLLMGGLAGCGGADIYAWALRTAPEALTGKLSLAAGLTEVLSNDRMTLSINGEDFSVQLTDKNRQVVWNSNPVEEKLTDSLKSQFSLSFYDANGNYSTMSSYADAVKRKQVTAYAQDDSLYVEYKLGDYELTADSIPQKLSIRRFESFVNKLPEEKAEQLTAYYRLYESESMYGIRPKGLNEFMAVRQLWLEAGYTEDDLLADNAEFGLNGAAVNRPYFTVVLQYTLNEDGFTVSVPTERLLFDDDYPLYDITLFENFGRTDRTEDGFMFLPDGSGALIRFDAKSTRREKASVAIYGDDLTVTTTAKLAQQVNSERAVLPVFGLKDGNAGYLAIIEEGQANAYVEAYRSGGYNAYNAIYPRFIVINKDNVYMEGSSSENSKVPQFQRTLFDGAYRVRYILLEDEVTYSEMACTYRDYLYKKGDLVKSGSHSVPLVVETIGGVTGYKNFLGVSYVGVKAATTYEQNIDILEAFREKGVSNLELVLTGWFGGGVYHEYPKSLNLIGVLGGKKGLQSLMNYTKDKGITVFPDVNLMTVYQSGNGFYAPNNASSTLDLNTAKLYTLSYASGLHREDDGVMQVESFILSPNCLQKVTDKFLPALQKLGFGAVSLRSSGNELYADYDRQNTVDRITSQQKSVESLTTIAAGVDKVMIREGNSYALPYATHIMGTATESSGFLIASEDVPFLQIVLHGSKALSGDPINLQPNYHTAVLKAAEYGMSLHLQLTHAEAHVLKNTDYAENFSSCYTDWVEIIAAQQTRLETALNPVADALMVEHETLASGLTVTRYDNGYAVYVNYTKTAQTVGEVTVPAEDFITVQEVAA